ncbi:hypothetical protein [Streptomyces sp. NPDC006971]|uniref:hypothetical protein n=1 Tax=Streptomyces sp. NPDC006971 TaxID=3154784 RepID=UPI0033FFC35E
MVYQPRADGAGEAGGGSGRGGVRARLHRPPGRGAGTAGIPHQRPRTARTDEEAEAEARRAYKTEQGLRWFQHNPNGADATAAATRAATAARERTAEHLLATRLDQLREQAAARTAKAAAAPWTDRLPELAAHPLNNNATGAVIA